MSVVVGHRLFLYLNIRRCLRLDQSTSTLMANYCLSKFSRRKRDHLIESMFCEGTREKRSDTSHDHPARTAARMSQMSETSTPQNSSPLHAAVGFEQDDWLKWDQLV